MKDGKTVSERMREYVATESAVAGPENVPMLRAMSDWADEIDAEKQDIARGYGMMFLPRDFKGNSCHIGDKVWHDGGWKRVTAIGGRNAVWLRPWEGGRLLDATLVPAANVSHEAADTQERIDEDARKCMTDYWDCGDISCKKCPSCVDGVNPRDRFGVFICEKAQTLDLLRRQRELYKAGA